MISIFLMLLLLSRNKSVTVWVWTERPRFDPWQKVSSSAQWGTILQSGRHRFDFRWGNWFFNSPNPFNRNVTLGTTWTWVLVILLGVKSCWLTNLPPPVSWHSRIFGSLDVLQIHGFLWPVTGIAYQAAIQCFNSLCMNTTIEYKLSPHIQTS